MSSKPQSDNSPCELEPIRFPGAVQPHGAVLVLRADGAAIEAASETCASLLGLDASRLVGAAPTLLIDPILLEQLLARTSAALAAPTMLELGGRRLAARASRNGQGQYLLDIEPAAGETRIAADTVYRKREQLAGLRRLRSVDAIASAATAVVADWTGFDRVMIYRFDDAWNGEVIAETCTPQVEPYFGLNFPASDIPRQARELFRLSRVRAIPDTHYTPSALLASGDRHAIDLGLSSLRSVSPIHLEYLENMDVRASLVAALEIEGRLWGLLACHHLQGPRYCPPAQRDDIAWLCEDLAAHLSETLLREQQARTEDMARRRQALVDEIRGTDFRTLIRSNATANILGVVHADGFALVLGQDIHSTGVTPSAARIRQMLALRRTRGRDPEILISDSVERDLGLPDDGDGVAGVLFVSVRHKEANTLIWFRQERRRSVQWAGDPANPHQVHEDGRITPRKSFALFLDTIRGQSLPWSLEQQASARELGALIEIEALREGEAFLKTVLDSSPEHMCVLDAHGVIVGINGAWQRFGEVNGASPEAINPLGRSYRAICHAALDSPNGNEAGPAWIGIESVLNGRLSSFSLDYPCDSPTERRWFRMDVYRMREPCEGVVIAHRNVTESKLTEIALKASEQRYLGLLEDQTELICRFKADGKIVYVNQAYSRFFGKPAELSLGSHWSPKVVTADLPMINARLALLAPATPVVTIENRVVAAGGVIRWVQFVNHAIYDGHGTLIEIQAVGRDITERRRAEESLRLESDKNRALLRSASDGVTIMDREGFLLDCSDSFCTMLGYAREALIGMHVSEWDCGFASDDALMAAIHRLFETTQRSQFQSRHRRKDGTVYEVEISVIPVELGSTQVLFGALRDITERKRSETAQREAHRRLEQVNRQLQLAMREAEQANLAKSRFLAAASHDLRQPLTSLSLYVEALKRLAPAETLELVGKIQNSSDSLSELLIDLLDLSKLDANVVTPSMRNCPLHEVLLGLVSDFAAEAEGKGLELRMRHTDLIAWTDPNLLRRAVGNLVVNAIRHSQTGGVLIGCRRHRGRDWIEVWDTGPGIPPDQTEAIFEEFVQLGETGRQRGSGLGLAIVAKTAKLLRVQIRLRSRVGRGSMFAIEFPRGIEPQAAEQLRDAPGATSLLIGLVEDDPAVLDATTLALQGCRHKVIAASSGAGLFDRLGAGAPDILISDYRLSRGENGFEVIRQARERFGAALPAILVTGDSDPQTLRTLSRTGICVCHKPIRLADLLARITELTAPAAVSPGS